ncbi:hypothetical protein FACS1894137_04960 [Spirochaetia bacterium]|nr:hypothetical protein FACS1894137_04960 [Spirochaetia bacterium]
MEHEKLITILRQNIKDAINDDGELNLYLQWPLEIPTTEEYAQLDALQYDYSAEDVDEALTAFDDLCLEKILCLRLKGFTLKRLPEQVRRLKNLQELFLLETGISHFPQWFPELVNLKNLYLEANGFSKRSVQLFNHLEPILKLPALEELHFSDDHSHSVTIPDLVGKCAHLKKLSLNGTNLTALPEWVRNLKGLTKLVLLGPLFTELPEWIGELARLESLWVCDTWYIRELPASIGNLTELKELILNSNDVPELPDSFSNLIKLQKLSIMGLGPNGDRDLKVIPEWIGNLTALKYLFLFNTDVACLPDSMANCTALECLVISNTYISELPAWMEELTALKKLEIQRTKIKEIPECLLQREAAGYLEIRRKDTDE